MEYNGIHCFCFLVVEERGQCRQKYSATDKIECGVVGNSSMGTYFLFKVECSHDGITRTNLTTYTKSKKCSKTYFLVGSLKLFAGIICSSQHLCLLFSFRSRLLLLLTCPFLIGFVCSVNCKWSSRTRFELELLDLCSIETLLA